MTQTNPSDPNSLPSAAPLASPYPQGQGQAKGPGSKQATWGFVLSLIGLLTSCVLIGIPIAIAGLIVSILALTTIKKSVQPVKGSGLATAGIALGAVAVVLIPVIALLLGVMLPALGAARKTANQMKNSTQVRGVMQGNILFSVGNGDYYPGISIASGTPVVTHSTAQDRIDILLQGNFFTREYVVNPVADGSETLSYALLGIGMGKNVENRAAEWQNTTNSQAVIVSDRMIANGSGMKSWWTNPSFNQSEWRGSTGWNDNHVEFVSSNVIPQTKYGRGSVNVNDDLFQSPAGGLDALMVYTDGQTP